MFSTRRKPVLVLSSLVFTLLLVLNACTSKSTEPKPGANYGADGTSAEYREPVTLSSKDGVLEVRLSAHEASYPLDTASKPVDGFLLFDYELIRGTASDGSKKGSDLYPAPTLHVEPGQRLIVHFDNDLQDLSIADFTDPAYAAVGDKIPLYPRMLTSSPLNLHTHGLHVSPDGDADNVLLEIPAGMGNVYDYAVPADMPHGLYWYHSHLHRLTTQHTYRGLAGMLEIGRPDGNLPIVTEKKLPIRTMALQYNWVFDRKGTGAHLDEPSRAKFVDTHVAPVGNQLADGTYEPLLTPVDFKDTTIGAQYFTNWVAGPGAPNPRRGANQFIPSNLQSFTSDSVSVPADPGLRDNERDVQFTVNGQFQPTLAVKPGQTEIWVLANISDYTSSALTLTETATGNHPKFAVVGQDGNPFPVVHPPVDGDGTTLVVPPGSRFAIAVTMPQKGDLVLEMAPQKGGEGETTNGVLYTNNGTDHPHAVLGTTNVDPSAISYVDGFFKYPSQKLLRAVPAEGSGVSVPFTDGQALNAYTSFVDTSVMTPAIDRQLVIKGGFSNDKASKDDPRAFTYEIADNTFPNIPLIQPRLNSVEEWQITNFNNDGHPMHIHVNDFQVMGITDPISGVSTGIQAWGEDNVAVPRALVDAQHQPLAPATTTLRTQFTDYAGTFVIHCHRLNHEDNGLMATVNVIPEVSTYAVTNPGSSGKPATVAMYDGNGDRLVSTVTPFASFDGTPTVAMADVNGDMILDLVVGTGAGPAAEVAAYSGAGPAPFTTELARFTPFGPDFHGGVNVAGADIDGNALADNIVVGAGPGIESQVKVFSSVLPAKKGTAPEVFSSFAPYPGSKAGVSVATGLVELTAGRPSIVTAPGPGEPARIKTFRFDLYKPTAAAQAAGKADAGNASQPTMTAEFLAFDEKYTGGVSLTTGWVAGPEGGAKSIVTSMLGDGGTVRVWSSGSRLDGAPSMYLESPDHHHSGMVTFRQTASFEPFGGQGVQVATTSTPFGADLLVSGPTGEVQKFDLRRAEPTATTLTPFLLTTIPAPSVTANAPSIGGR
ncbi:multicopper oxidase family protein [Smaragdicoccus niigatensis]|uniref:multicopper oxidase family protein n=1 Tax=Smaragdicoccus niigatensis TaxID=359359 RepID=UPI000369172F|nr:multicopper oxidase domain-containing protein [Smaragdicoccus niigatensis]